MLDASRRGCGLDDTIVGLFVSPRHPLLRALIDVLLVSCDPSVIIGDGLRLSHLIAAAA